MHGHVNVNSICSRCPRGELVQHIHRRRRRRHHRPYHHIHHHHHER
jgi:hypothetical protein